jgi:membrane-bound inhibitor of C-type lysozyme
MATSLLEGLTGLMTPSLLSTAARNLGESEASVAGGLGASFSTILAALAGKAGTPLGLGPIFDVISSPTNDGSVVKDPQVAAAVTPDSPLGALSGRLLSKLFGSQFPSIAHVVTRSSGLRAGSGGSLLNTAAPLVLGVLGNRVRAGGLSPAGLAGLLTGERDQIVRALPAGLGMIPGVGSLLGLKVTGREAAAVGAAAPGAATVARGWLGPAFAVLALAVVLWGLARASRSAAVDQAVGAVQGTAENVGEAAGDLEFNCGQQRITLGHVGDRTVLTTDRGTFDLRRIEAASGAKYEAFIDASTTFWNNGDRAMLAVRGRPYPACTRTAE